MQDISRFLWVLIIALVLLALVFGIAIVAVPGFRDSVGTAALIAAILAPLSTTVSVVAGLALNRGVKEAVREESRTNNLPTNSKEQKDIV